LGEDSKGPVRICSRGPPVLSGTTVLLHVCYRTVPVALLDLAILRDRGNTIRVGHPTTPLEMRVRQFGFPIGAALAGKTL
jgi:hypothetical protein